MALDRELEDNVLVGQSLVHLRESVELGLDVDQILGVKEDLEDLGAVNSISDALADNLGGVDNVLEAETQLFHFYRSIEIKCLPRGWRRGQQSGCEI